MSGRAGILVRARAVLGAASAAVGRLEAYANPLAMAIALVLSAAFVYVAWDYARGRAEEEARIRFQFRVSQMVDAIGGRMIDYEQVLRSGEGLFAASLSVERAEWRAFVARLRIEAIYPGIQGVGFAARVPATGKSGFERAVRAQGFPDYAVHPPGERAEYFPILYLEPFEGRNLRAFGYDMFSEPVRRAAMERARDTGQPAMTGRVTLVQETDKDVQAGFLMYVPIYRKDADARNIEARRAALTGYVYSPFRMNDLMRGILGEMAGVRLRIYDGDPGRDGAMLFDNARTEIGRQHAPAFESSATLPMGGRVWTLRAGSLPGFEAAVEAWRPVAVALAAAIISSLVLAIIWSLATMRARAVALARSMTKDLRESRERLALAVEGSNQALFDWDVMTGKVVLSEQWSRILGGGAGRTETTVDELLALVHPDDRRLVQEKSADLVRGRLQFYHIEHRVRALGGGYRWIVSRAKVVDRDNAGRSLRVAGTNLDITGRKEIERFKDEFIATVSHELRTPLTAIVGALGLLGEQTSGKLSPEAATFLKMAQQNSERLAALINDVLDIEKIESGRMEFRADAVAIAPLLERAVELNAPYADKLGVRLELSRPLPDATVAGDEDRLLQVLTNLLSNAAKFSPAGAAVTVSAAIRGRSVRVAIADRGPGVPAEFRGRIFGKFAQADGSDTRGRGGTGLGLSISQAIVEKHGGTIGFDSVPGAGATFYFELPLREA